MRFLLSWLKEERKSLKEKAEKATRSDAVKRAKRRKQI
jgi:hypothetical protein